MVENPGYAVNVDVAVRRECETYEKDERGQEGEGSETGGENEASGENEKREQAEYLFIVRGEDEEHAPGTLGFPGGTLEADPGESGVLAATAVREVREEVGVEIENVETVTSTTFELDTGRPCLNVVVVADYAGGEAHVADSDEVGDVAWRTPESVLADEATPPWTTELVEDVVTYREAGRGD